MSNNVTSNQFGISNPSKSIVKWYCSSSRNGFWGFFCVCVVEKQLSLLPKTQWLNFPNDHLMCWFVDTEIITISHKNFNSCHYNRLDSLVLWCHAVIKWSGFQRRKDYHELRVINRESNCISKEMIRCKHIQEQEFLMIMIMKQIMYCSSDI